MHNCLVLFMWYLCVLVCVLHTYSLLRKKEAIDCSFFFHCSTSVVGDISTVIFLQSFRAILLSPLFLKLCTVWLPELCVITQLETISLLHICCQGSAKIGAIARLGDLTSSHSASELPTPIGRKSNTFRSRGERTKEHLSLSLSPTCSRQCNYTLYLNSM